MNIRISIINSMLLFGLILFSSCEEEDNDVVLKINSLDQNDYFPMHLGNYWDFSFTSDRFMDITELIDGIYYYRVVTEHDTVFYRKTVDGKVYEKTKRSNEILKFDLNADEGDVWICDSENMMNASLISKNETIILDNHTFKNCYKYFFDSPQLVDEEYFIWLAPGVGFIEIQYLGGASTRILLKNVIINGVEIQF